MTNGTDGAILDALKAALVAEGAELEIIAPTIGGVVTSNGTHVAANQKIGGGPSVIYDAVAVLPSAEGVADLLKNKSAIDFVSDAYAHLKFIASR